MIRQEIENIKFENTNWNKIQKGYDNYLWIMINSQNLDVELKRNFAHFYKLNIGMKNSNDKTIFFNLLNECIKNNQDDYAAVVKKLSLKTGRNEMSFASKIVATVNTHKPIIDRIVLGHLKISRPCYGDLNYRISKSIDIYNEIEEIFNEFINSIQGMDLIDTFNKKIKQHQNFKITDIKKLDFILWQTRK